MIAPKIPQILLGAKVLLRSLRPTHGYSSLVFVFIACLGGAATSALATTYYVSPSGSDGNSGTSTSTPWQTITKVNSALFQPGDSVLFQGSGTFSGALVFSYATNIPTSSAANVITVGSYGTGPATILSTGSGSGSSAITLNGVNGIAVTGLTILGAGGTSPITWCGVKISNGSGYGISKVTVNNCDISNFAGSSFAQTAEVYLSGGSGLDTINITNNALHGANGPGSLDSNGIYGIGNGQNITNVTYSGNTVYNLGGVASNQGGGIVANGVNGGVLEYNIVHDVGGNTTSCGGVAGVWAYYSNNITIQYNEVYNVRPITYTAGCDWNAYDLDGGVTNSVVQYNYSHNNAGGAMLAFVANVGGATWGDNTFRYNISENDGLGAGNWVSAAITITGSPQNALEMYGNTIYSGMRNSTNNSSMIQSNQGHSITLSPDSFITNNIFYMTPQAGVQMMYCPYGISGGTIDYNIYYTTGTSSVWRTTTNYTKFADYQVNTGYDLHSFQLDPQLAGPGTAGTLSWTPSLHDGPQPAPGAYQLSSSSPAIDAGVILSGSSVDYYGSPVPNGSGENIGADSAGSTTLPLITSARALVDFTGLAFSYQVTALNSPTSFGATGLPSGLSLNSTTGVISGTTTLSGTFNITLSAINSSGTSTATLVLISRPPPVITSATAVTATNNIRFKYQITASNYPTSYNATNLPAGLSFDSSKGLISGIPTATGTTSVTISATNAAGTGSANLTITVVPLPPPVTYYVSNSGSDSNNGTSTSTPWQTIAKVNSALFHSGDSVLFQGSGTFSGALVFSYATNVPESTPLYPITVGSYGTGSATILSTSSGSGSSAITLNGVNGIAVTGLTILGAGGTSPITWIGVNITNGSGYGISKVTVNNCDISNFAGTAAANSAEVRLNGGSGLDTINITNNTLHGANGPGSLDSNGIYGVGTGKQNTTNVTYSGNTVYNLGGVGANTGGGIVANDVNGGVLEYNIVHDIGGNTTSCGGVAGVWAYASNNITIQYNEVYNVRPITYTAGCDWNAYDLDGGVSNSVVQYNYSHNNAGSALLAFVGNVGSETWGDNTFCYNISENDGLGSGNYASSAITITGSPQRPLEMYGNTIYSGMRSSTNGSSMIQSNQGHAITLSPDSFITNNIFYMTPQAGTQMMYCPYGISGGTIDYNIYYTTGTSSVWRTTANYTKFEDYQVNTGYDLHSFQLDPQLVSPGTAGTLSWTPSLHNGPQPAPGAYRLSSNSPAIDAGVILSGSSVGYYGDPTPNAGGENIGADTAGSTTLPVITSVRAATGVVNTAFNYTITASHSPTSYNAANLPAGLSVNTGTGVISGTPTVAGTTNVTISATNASGTGTATLILIVQPQPPVINSALTATGMVSNAFSYQIAASNSPTSYNATGLPSGLSVNTGTGAITGTPTASGTSSVTLSASNTGGTGTATLTLTVMPYTPPPVINSASTATGTAGSAFSYQIAASNSPTSYNATGLPSGLSVNTGTGAITGTPTASGTNSVTLSATNAGGTGTATLTLTVSAGPTATITVTPASATLDLEVNGTQQFSAVAKDGLGNVLNPQPVIAWTVSGGGTIDGSGLFTAGSSPGGPYTVTATSGSISGTATVSLLNNVADGTWTNTAGGLWSNIANWSGGSGPVAAGSGFTADFSTLDMTAATTVNLDSARNIGTLVFADTATGTAGSWVLANNGSAGNILTFGGAATVTVNAMANGTVSTSPDVTISAVIDGSSGLIKNGTATNTVNGGSVKSTSALVLSGANTYTGATDIQTGMVVAKNATALGGSTVTVESGASLVLSTGGTANTITLKGGNALVAAGLGGTATLSGAIDLQSDSSAWVTGVGGNNKLAISSAGSVALGSHVLTINTQGSANTATIDGTVTGGTASGIAISGGGPLTVSGNNTGYSGTTTVGKGELRIGSDTALGDGTLVLAPGNDSNAFVDSASAGAARTLANAVGFGASNAGSRFLFASRNAANLTFTNTTAIALGSLVRKVEVWNSTQAQFDAGFTGTGGITLNLQGGNGTLVLNGASTYTGATTISAGTLVVNGSLAATAVSVNATGTLAGTGGIGGGVTVNSNGHLACAIASAPGSQLPLAITGALTLGSGNILDLTATSTPAAGVYTLATAAGGVTYTAGTVNLTGVSGVVSVSGNSLILTITAPPVITSALSANGTVGNAFSYQITASNSPTSYNAAGLPSGLSVNTSTGAITGTPASAGTSSVTISADNAGGSGSATLTITVSPPAPVINSALSANGTAGGAFSYQITASNSPTSYGASGLPAGLSVNTGTGLISGTPTATGTSNVTISASNAGGTGGATLTITVSPPAPVINSALSANGTAGSAFSYQIAASNSPTSYNATGLPSGLSVNTSTGAITGTPTASGTSSVTLSATNAGGVGTATLTLTVSAGPIATISVSPATATVFSGSTGQFSAVAEDSFGNALNPQPVIAWTVSGGGTIDGNGLFTADFSTGGPYTVTATSGSTSGTATVSVAENVADGTWTNTAGGLWNSIANWSGGSGPVAAGSGFTADFSTLDITAATTVNLDSAHNIGTLVFGDTATGTAGSWVLANNGSAGNILTFGGAATVTVNAMANGTVSTAPGVTISAVIAGSSINLVKNGSASNTVNGGAVKSTSALVLSGANTYTGTTDIQTGMVVAKNATALGGSTVTVESGASLVLSTGGTANNITLKGSNTLVVAGLGGTATLSGAIDLQSDSSAWVTDAGGNNKLAISSAGSVALGSHVLTINTQGSANTATISGTVTGDAASGITISGGGPLTVSGNNTGYHGTTTVGKGELRIGGDSALGDGALVLAPGNDSNAFVDSASVGAARILANAVGFGVSNAGSRFLFSNRNAANLTFTNTTAIALGSLVRKIEVWNGIQTRFDAGFTGTGGITLNLQGGNGTLVLNGASTYTGATTVNAGTLVVNGSLGATAVSVNATGTLAGTGGIGGGVTVNSNGHLACAIASAPGSQVPLAITGALTLGSGNILDLTATATPAAGVYTLATAAGGVTYTAGTVNLTGVSGVVSVSGNSLILTITAP